AGATRRTDEGSGETALGGRRGGDGRVTATAGSAGTRNSTARSAVRRRRIIGPPGSTVAVLALVPRAELARLQRPPPGLVLAVPAHRRLQRGGERIARRPAELPDLRGIHRVATVVARAVGDRPDERVRLAGESQDLPGEGDVLHLVAAADVVDLAVAPPAQPEVDGRAIVQPVEPVGRGTAASSVKTPKTSVRRNPSGSTSERSTCDSAARFTMASTPRATSRTSLASQMSPCTKA